MLNDNRFKGRSEIITSANPIKNVEIPELYKKGEYDKIIQYIKTEAEDFLTFY